MSFREVCDRKEEKFGIKLEKIKKEREMGLREGGREKWSD